MKKLTIFVFISLLFLVGCSNTAARHYTFETTDGKALEAICFSSESDITKNLHKGLSEMTGLSDADCKSIETSFKRCAYKECTESLDKNIKDTMKKDFMTHVVIYEPISNEDWKFELIWYSTNNEKYHIKNFNVSMNTNNFIISHINGVTYE